MSNENLEKLVRENIEATERTTNAVRGIASFLLIEVTSAIIGALLIWIGIANDAFGWITAGVIVIVGGLFWATIELWAEIGNSRKPKSFKWV